MQDPRVLATRRQIEREMLLLSSDEKKADRSVLALQAEKRALETQKKRLILELDRSTALLRSEENKKERIRVEIATLKRRLNTLR